MSLLVPVIYHAVLAARTPLTCVYPHGLHVFLAQVGVFYPMFPVCFIIGLEGCQFSSHMCPMQPTPFVPCKFGSTYMALHSGSCQFSFGHRPMLPQLCFGRPIEHQPCNPCPNFIITLFHGGFAGPVVNVLALCDPGPGALPHWPPLTRSALVLTAAL
ncbi:hypothetical protein R1flu_027255 [Riccia fluitans]|uniref:NADH dehydrogenase subunit 6 n=1 Tax=Riccia fluitans TaxID=41844 RepID=A0ABD1XIA0_9MARC